MRSAQGSHMVKKGLETRGKVKAYIEAHPEALRQDVCRALDITRITLRRHLVALGLNGGKS